MKIIVKGVGETTLTQRHYVATGGQASVYVKDGVAYKIYTDPKDAIPEAKFKTLSSISDLSVVKPDKLILSETKVPLGYTMMAISDTYSLCQFFTRAFRDREGVSNDTIVDLTNKLREHVINVHTAGVLIVDLNELNLLVPMRTRHDVFLIDVDSYQTPGYPATVIMPSVRDYTVRAADFSEKSDWFSFGVLAFQMFIGSHPYKGNHAPSMSIEKDQRMVHRMKNHISAFQSDVKLPGCCYPFDVIPQGFRDWLKAVLQEGKRMVPPDLKQAAVVVIAARPAITSTGAIMVTEILDLEGWTLVSHAESGNARLHLASRQTNVTNLMMDGVKHQTEARAVLDRRTVGTAFNIKGVTLAGFTPVMNWPIGFNLYDSVLTFMDLGRKQTETLPFRAQEIARAGDRFYIKNGTQVLEIEFSELANKIIVTASHMVADVLEMASHLYEGCAIQNMLGSIFVSLFPRSKAGYQVRMPELDVYRIVEAKFEGSVLMVIGTRGGKYDRLVFRFDPDFSTYDVRVVSDISPSGLNFITLDSGVCVCVTEEEKIEAFSAKKDGKGMKVVDDEVIGSDMRLLKVNGKVGFERGGKIYQMTLK